MARVWVPATDLQCCGQGWSVGDVVTWTVHRPQDRAFLEAVAGDEARHVTHVEEHHQDDLVEARVTGRVTEVFAVSCRYAPRHSDRPTELYPVPGTTLLEPLTTVEPWRSAPSADVELVGFLATLEEG